MRHRTRSDQGRGHARIAQHPGDGHLRQSLATTFGDGVQRLDAAQIVLRQQALIEGAGLGGTGIGRHAFQILRAQQALGQGREGDAARTEIRPAAQADSSSIQRLIKE